MEQRIIRIDLQEESRREKFLKLEIKILNNSTLEVSDLLEYSRLSAKVTREKVNLNDLIEEVLIDFDYLTETKKAIININKLPTIQGIPTQLRQVFQNLIGNSLM